MFDETYVIGGLSSFQFPVPVPVTDPDTGTLFQVCFNSEYLPLILGCLLQARQPSTWNTTDESVLAQTFGRVDTLLTMFMEGCPVIFPGMMVDWPSDTAPDGWGICDGSALSRTTYAALFAFIGTRYGAGDLVTTFNIPDFRSRVAVGAGQQGVGHVFSLGETGGEETHTLTGGEVPSHSHTDVGHTHTTGNVLPDLAVGPGELPVLSPNPIPGITGIGNASLTSSGGDGAHNNLQPYVVTNKIIRLV